MTTIIMVKTPEGVQIGYDSAMTGQNQTETLDPKVFVNNGIIYGVSGSTAYINDFRYADLPALTGDPARWVTKEFAPAYRALLKALRPDAEQHDIVLLLCTPCGHVFEVSSEGAWDRNTSGMYAVGSGTAYALGALHAGATVQAALAAAASHDTYTGGTLHTTTAANLLAP